MHLKIWRVENAMSSRSSDDTHEIYRWKEKNKRRRWILSEIKFMCRLQRGAHMCSYSHTETNPMPTYPSEDIELERKSNVPVSFVFETCVFVFIILEQMAIWILNANRKSAWVYGRMDLHLLSKLGEKQITETYHCQFYLATDKRVVAVASTAWWHIKNFQCLLRWTKRVTCVRRVDFLINILRMQYAVISGKSGRRKKQRKFIYLDVWLKWYVCVHRRAHIPNGKIKLNYRRVRWAGGG